MNKFRKRHVFHRKAAAALLAQAVSLADAATIEVEEVVSRFKTSAELGLTKSDAIARLKTFGPNVIASEKRVAWYARLLKNLKDPLAILLVVLGLVSFFASDARTAIVILVMLLLAVGLRSVQELRSDKAAERLKAMVRTTATVIRGGATHELALHSIVPGDIVRLSAGDMVPADVRLLSSRDLFVNQASLTGESMPIEKHATALATDVSDELAIQNVCFMGSNVVGGTATALVVLTGASTRFGKLAASVVGRREETSFDKGVQRFTWLMIRFMLVMAPVVFFANWLGRGDVVEAFTFALAVAVGLTPELLPMIVTVNLSKGALAMSRKKVIVKRLNAIQNFGAMDVLCTDKTGTLTLGKVTLVRHMDIEGKEDDRVLDYAYLNSFHETGLKNILDAAVLKHCRDCRGGVEREYVKVDEIPFDFERRMMSVVVADKLGKHVMITKGAVEEVLARCTHVEVRGKRETLAKMHHASKEDMVRTMSAEGYRLIALAYKELPPEKIVYRTQDESDLVLLGFLAFLDPPKETAMQTLSELARLGVEVKILTGDNELVTRRICDEVGLGIKRILLGSEVEAMDDGTLALAVAEANIFDKLDPDAKARVVRALQAGGHVVGFLGDGVNDAPALRVADVGISVDGAVDVAKESSDIILLEKSLLVLKDGVVEGRRVFGNIEKYMKMAASSNFGNMFSVVGASVFLPFLPMLPIQIVLNNLLYDLSQSAIPTDSVDAEYLEKPRAWRMDSIGRFILFVGPVSSIFDYLTFFMMLYVFNAWTDPVLFHTGWFVESLLTQTLVIHVIRTNRIPFLQSRASLPLIATTLAVAVVGVALPFSPVADVLGFKMLPVLYWFLLAAMLIVYMILAQIVKRWVNKRYAGLVSS